MYYCIMYEVHVQKPAGGPRKGRRLRAPRGWIRYRVDTFGRSVGTAQTQAQAPAQANRGDEGDYSIILHR